jgi:hypothetical protein
MGPGQNETYPERVAKYVPGEVVAAYLAAIQVIGASKGGRFDACTLYEISFFVCLVATPVYLLLLGKPQEPRVLHAIVSTGAFVVWAYALGGIFVPACWNLHDATAAALLLIGFTLLSGLVKPK